MYIYKLICTKFFRSSLNCQWYFHFWYCIFCKALAKKQKIFTKKIGLFSLQFLTFGLQEEFLKVHTHSFHQNYHFFPFSLLVEAVWKIVYILWGIHPYWREICSIFEISQKINSRIHNSRIAIRQRIAQVRIFTVVKFVDHLTWLPNWGQMVKNCYYLTPPPGV